MIAKWACLAFLMAAPAAADFKVMDKSRIQRAIQRMDSAFSEQRQKAGVVEELEFSRLQKSLDRTSSENLTWGSIAYTQKVDVVLDAFAISPSGKGMLMKNADLELLLFTEPMNKDDLPASLSALGRDIGFNYFYFKELSRYANRIVLADKVHVNRQAASEFRNKGNTLVSVGAASFDKDSLDSKTDDKGWFISNGKESAIILNTGIMPKMNARNDSPGYKHVSEWQLELEQPTISAHNLIYLAIDDFYRKNNYHNFNAAVGVCASVPDWESEWKASNPKEWADLFKKVVSGDKELFRKLRLDDASHLDLHYKVQNLVRFLDAAMITADNFWVHLKKRTIVYEGFEYTAGNIAVKDYELLGHMFGLADTCGQ